MRSRQIRVLAAVVAIAALLAFVVPIPQEIYWPIVVFAAVLAAYGTPAKPRGSGSRSANSPSGTFLCDRCKYNDVRYCSVPERPNATRCDDFKPQ